MTAGAAVLSSLFLTVPAQAAEKGFHSEKGHEECWRHTSADDTAWIYVKGAGKIQVSWKVPGGKLHTKKYWLTPDGISSRTFPTWKVDAHWKVTSIYGTKKNLTEVYGYCSVDGKPAGS